ncbi:MULTISPECIES: hypothetical protein [unclassified Polaromonas]|uniref:hypothetical protein n=1 Tax=unclassified Polaromonas TaxID=2638319 RepID=UPI001E3285BC|nr:MULTISPECIES: hypothetical protein [unclassified Polaromonas]
MIKIIRRSALMLLAGVSVPALVGRAVWAGVPNIIKSEFQDYVTLEQFGAKGDGVSDDSTALEKAASTGKEIHIQKDKIYQINIQKTINKDIRIVGGGTLLFSTIGRTALLCTGRVYLEEVTLDGNNIANELIRCTGSEFKMVGGIVKNVFNLAARYNITGIQITDCDSVNIYGVNFSSICGPGNGVIGDSIGAIAAIQITGSCNHGVIKGCNFVNVNNRQNIGEKSNFEDADAIRCYSTTGDQNIEISENVFFDIGKRAAKFSGTENSIYAFEKNVITSGYSKTVDDGLVLGNGMFSVVSCYSGYFVARANWLVSGVVGYFFEGGTAKLKSVELVGNTYAPEFHKTVNTSVTRFSYIGKILNSNIYFKEYSNKVINTYRNNVVFNNKNYSE